MEPVKSLLDADCAGPSAFSEWSKTASSATTPQQSLSRRTVQVALPSQSTVSQTPAVSSVVPSAESLVNEFVSVNNTDYNSFEPAIESGSSAAPQFLINKTALKRH